MVISVTTFFSIIYGCVVGLIWSLALDSQFKSGLIYGAIIGFIVGLFFGYTQKKASKNGNITQQEASIVAANMMQMMLVVGVVLGLVTWLIRILFFNHN